MLPVELGNVTCRTEFQCNKRRQRWLGTSFVSLKIINHPATNIKYNKSLPFSPKKIKIDTTQVTLTAGMLKGQFSTFPSLRAPQISYIAQYPADCLPSTLQRTNRICIGKFNKRKEFQRNSKENENNLYFPKTRKMERERTFQEKKKIRRNLHVFLAGLNFVFHRESEEEKLL